jgi:hypothetical protein
MELLFLAAVTLMTYSRSLTPLKFAAGTSDTLTWMVVNWLAAALFRAFSAMSLPLVSLSSDGGSVPLSPSYSSFSYFYPSLIMSI